MIYSDKNFKFYLKVCISGLFFNNEQVFVGPNNDIEHFSMDQDGLICSDEKMKTSTISIKNGIVLDSECKGLSNYSGLQKIDAFLVCSELENASIFGA